MPEVKDLHQEFQRETRGGIHILHVYATIAKGEQHNYIYRSNGVMLIHNLGGIVEMHTSQLAAACGKGIRCGCGGLRCLHHDRRRPASSGMHVIR